jgi:arabinan endo-1,5-alpha-L-arabinosidase
LTQAPDVSKLGNVYYLLYSVTAWGTQDSEIGFATSPDLGNWTDYGTTGVSSSSTQRQPYNAIHGSLVHASNGQKHYLVFGSFGQGLYIADMENIPTRNIGSAQQMAYRAGGVEAGFIFEYKKTWYLFFSAGSGVFLDKNRPPKGQEYQIMACKSRSSTGPYEDLQGRNCKQGGGTAILASHDWVYAPGSQGVFNDRIEGPVIYYSYSQWLLRSWLLVDTN